MRDDDVVAELRRRLKRACTEKLVTYLDRLGFIDEVSRGASTHDDLEREARAVLAVAASAERAEPVITATRQRSSGKRTWALSVLVTCHVRTDPIVARFRNYYLPDGIIPYPHLPDWIQTHAQNQPRTVDVTTTLPHAALDGMGFTPQSESRIAISQIASRVLDYAGPDDQWVRRVSASAGSILDATRTLGQQLAETYFWQPAQATSFLLSDVTPIIPLIRTTTSTRRITLSIDPNTAPETVAASYREARRAMGLPRVSALSDKHATLAVFALVDHADAPWATRFSRWNKEFPAWRYTQQSNLRRDAQSAATRLLREYQIDVPKPDTIRAGAKRTGDITVVGDP